MRQVRQIMGMPITIDVPNCQERAVFLKAFERLTEIDERFSTYKNDSEVSRYGRAEIRENELSPELKEVIEKCGQAEKSTDGYFSAWAAGAFDPSGYVKGWAIAQAGKLIEEQGYKTYCIGAGGDILARSASGKIWHVGIQDPTDKAKILNKLSISNGAVATSGSYERGPHIFNPITKKMADELLSVTVTGPDIITADILATAVFASGQQIPAFLSRHREYEALVISRRSRGNNP